MAKRAARKRRVERGSITHLRKTHKNMDILLPLFALAALAYLTITFLR